MRESVWVLEQGNYEMTVLGVFSSKEVAEKYVSDWKLTETVISEEIVDALLTRKIGHYRVLVCVAPDEFDFEYCSITVEVKDGSWALGEDDPNDLDSTLEYSRSDLNPSRYVFLESCGSTEEEAMNKAKVLFDAWVRVRTEGQTK